MGKFKLLKIYVNGKLKEYNYVNNNRKYLLINKKWRF